MNKIKIIPMVIMIFKWSFIMKSDNLSDSSFFLLEINTIDQISGQTNKSLNDLFCYINIMQL